MTRTMIRALALSCAVLAGGAGALSGQELAAPGADTVPALDSLVAHALSVHPGMRAARDRVEAARAAIAPAGTPPDPMLMAGVMNFPVSEPGFGDFMTMSTLGVAQRIPYPGRLRLQQAIAEAELTAAEARLEASRWSVAATVREAYYELAFYDRALEVVRSHEGLLTSFIRVTESRYGVGIGTQADVLKARVEVARLAEEAVTLTEQRRVALARLNAALDRPSDTPLDSITVPARIARAAIPESASGVRFRSSALGARAADSPLPPLTELQEAAVRGSPAIRAHQAMIAAQAARVELARKAHLPDFEVSLQYGQRHDRTDMVSASVAIPIPLRKGSRQNMEVKEAQAHLSALQAEHHEKANELRARVAELYAELERERTRLALFVKSVIPQGRAALESATASFQVGRVDLLALLESQATLYDYETAYFQSLTTFARRLAELERVVGKEVL